VGDRRIGTTSCGRSTANSSAVANSLDHPKFKTQPASLRQPQGADPDPARRDAKEDAQEWFDIFERHAIPYSPINTLKQICDDPHIAHRKMLVEIDQPIVGKCGSAPRPSSCRRRPERCTPPRHAGRALGAGAARSAGLFAREDRPTSERGRDQTDRLIPWSLQCALPRWRDGSTSATTCRRPAARATALSVPP